MNMLAARFTPDATLREEVLFASADLLVRRIAAGTGGLCYVTFDSYTDDRRLERPGFGQHFLQARGIDAIHVISRDNHWYQYPELDAALAAVARATHGYAQVIAYGSSMGGFAALNYGRACGATIGIALSPQYSVDRRIVPFEDRWADDMSRIAFRDDPPRPLPRQYLLYDPRDLYDRAHAELFAARSPSVMIPIAHAGHPVGSYLNETGLFQTLFDGVHADALDTETYVRELRRRRRQSGQYLFTLAQRVPARRMRQKLGLARAAVATNPLDPSYASYLACVLDEAGAHRDARALHDRAVAMTDRAMHPLHNLMLHHERVGELETATRIVDELVAAHPAVLLFRQSAARLRRKRRHARPLGRLARLLRLDPLLDRIGQRRRRDDPARA